MKKQILSVLLAIAILSSAACSNSKDQTSAASSIVSSEISKVETTSAQKPETSEAPKETNASTETSETASSGPVLTPLSNQTQREKNQYDLHVTLDDTNKTLKVDQKLKYVNNTDANLDEIYFNVIPAAFSKNGGKVSFDSVQANGKALSMDNVQETVYKIKLDTPLKKGDTLDLDMQYTLTIPGIANRYGYVKECYNLGNFIATPALFENGNWLVQPYIDIGDAFYTEIADYKVKIDVPEGYTVCASGTLKDGVYEASDMRDFAFSAAKDLKVLTEKHEDCTIHVYYSEACQYQAETVMKSAKESLELFNKTLGKYPYESLSLLLCSVADDIGGMEYPGMILLQTHNHQDILYKYVNGLLSDDEIINEIEKGKLELGLPEGLDGEPLKGDELKKEILATTSELNITTAHEIAHQWFYGIVGNDEIRHAWLDEGFARFFDHFYAEKCLTELDSERFGIGQLIGANQYFTDQYNGKTSGDMYADLNKSLYDYRTQPLDYWDIYEKGAALLSKFYYDLGEDAFVKNIKEYVQTFAFSEVDPEEFKDFWSKKGNFEEVFKIYFQKSAN